MPHPAKTSQDAVLAAAIEIVEREGAAALSMRAIARRLGLSPNALYHHFEDRRELEAEVAAEGFRQLGAAVKRARGRYDGAEGVVRASRATLRFARTRSELYGLMMRKHPLTPRLREVLVNLEALSGDIYGWLGSPEKIAEATVAIFAMLHGLVVLENAGVYEHAIPRDPSAAIAAILAGLSGD